MCKCKVTDSGQCLQQSNCLNLRSILKCTRFDNRYFAKVNTRQHSCVCKCAIRNSGCVGQRNCMKRRRNERRRGVIITIGFQIILTDFLTAFCGRSAKPLACRCAAPAPLPVAFTVRSSVRTVPRKASLVLIFILPPFCSRTTVCAKHHKMHGSECLFLPSPAPFPTQTGFPVLLRNNPPGIAAMCSRPMPLTDSTIQGNAHTAFAIQTRIAAGSTNRTRGEKSDTIRPNQSRVHNNTPSSPAPSCPTPQADSTLA